MSFTVDENAIRAYARRMEDTAQDARAARDYVATHTTMAWHQEGLLNQLQSAHERLVAEMTGRMAHLMDIFDQSSAAVDGAASYYRHTDAASAARVDATLPTVSRGEEDVYDAPRED